MSGHIMQRQIKWSPLLSCTGIYILVIKIFWKKRNKPLNTVKQHLLKMEKISVNPIVLVFVFLPYLRRVKVGIINSEPNLVKMIQKNFLKIEIVKKKLIIY